MKQDHNFSTESVHLTLNQEEWEFFRNILWNTISKTNNFIYEPKMIELVPDYCLFLIEERKLCFEWLREKDFNLLALESLVTRIKGFKNDQTNSNDI